MPKGVSLTVTHLKTASLVVQLTAEKKSGAANARKAADGEIMIPQVTTNGAKISRSTGRRLKKRPRKEEEEGKEE